MRKLKSNKNLWGKERFRLWEAQKKRWLKNLSLNKALRLQESLLSSDFIWLWRKNFFKDNPISLRNSLKKNR